MPAGRRKLINNGLLITEYKFSYSLLEEEGLGVGFI
jgi:hypothetical protein